MQVDAGRSRDPHGFICHSESGALPLPATKYALMVELVDTLVLEASAQA
jgi:hypothetical protein